jgi:hypothetical protein
MSPGSQGACWALVPQVLGALVGQGRGQQLPPEGAVAGQQQQQRGRGQQPLGWAVAGQQLRGATGAGQQLQVEMVCQQ